MAGPNGAAAESGVLTLPDIAYERKLVRTTINGAPVALDGWVNGPGCPGRVKAEFARIRQRLIESSDAGALGEFFTDAMHVVFERPRSEYDVLDLLAGDQQRAETILLFLKWRAPDTETAPDPEAPGEERSTTAPSSLTSAAPSAAPARTAAAGSTSPKA